MGRTLFLISFTVLGLSSICRGIPGLSTVIRHRSTYFENFGIYEKNRMNQPGSVVEHEFRADIEHENEISLIQFRFGKWIGEPLQLKRAPEETLHRIHQAYIELPFQSYPELKLRIGRQELKYNREILVGANDWDMTGFSFDAAKFYWDGPAWDVDILYGKQAGASENTLAGINIENTSPQKTVKELYAWYTALPHDQDKIPLIGNPEFELVTVGARIEGKVSRPLFYHAMANFQTGRTEDFSASAPKRFDVEAYHLLFNLDWFVNHPVIRNTGVEISVSSGDDGSTSKHYETFLPPFASDHNRSGAMDWMSHMNSRILTAYIFLDLHTKIETLVEFHQFYLHSGESAWYLGDLSPGWWSGTSAKGWPNLWAPTRDIGSEIDFHARIQGQDDRQISLGYSLFFPGRLLRHKDFWNSNKNVQWAYVQTELKF